MIKENLEKLKKYLFFISSFFLLASFLHIFYNYVYFDAKSIPVKGGTISEGIVGDISHFNPLISTTDDNKYVISILYRSLLKYDVKEKKLVGDLANCDISNLAYVECFLENNIYWSDGEPITTADIVSTYNILKTTDTNPIIKSLISETTIEEKNNSVVFKNTKKDINFLNVFFQPILPKNVIDNLGISDLTKPFYPSKESIYSGKYKVASVKEDKNLGIMEVSLEKNDKYFNNPVYIDKIILKFFKNSTYLLRNKDSINIFNDDTNLIGKSVPRLEPHYYTLPKYTAIFINSEKVVSKSLRNFLLNKIDKDKLIKVLGTDKYKQVTNPYLTEYVIDKNIENKNIESIMKDNGYLKKPELAKLILGEDQTTTESGSVTSNETSTTKEPTIDEIEAKENTSINYIISGLSKKYTFVTEDDILLKGDPKNENPDAIYINEYKLKGFSKGDNYFYFRLKEQTYETIKEGRNDYKIFFEKNGKKTLKEEMIVFYYKDKNKLESAREEFYKSFTKTENVITEVKEENKPAIDPVIKAKLDAIDDKYFYNKNLEKFSLKLMYIGGEKDLADTSEFIKTTLGEYGIDVQVQAINLLDLSKLISSGASTESYDMMLAGINLGYFDFNIYPYFHSSQAKLGYNFSNIKKLSLDIMLEDINSNKLSLDKVKELQDKSLAIIKEEQVVKTLYTPLVNFLVDKNIKNFKMDSSIPNQVSRFDYLLNIYINEKRNINYEQKGFIDFFRFLLKIITG
nr:ABC transporter substrate-binding protein [Candidatus Gracilibacteria bacterium]